MIFVLQEDWRESRWKNILEWRIWWIYFSVLNLETFHSFAALLAQYFLLAFQRARTVRMIGYPESCIISQIVLFSHLFSFLLPNCFFFPPILLHLNKNYSDYFEQVLFSTLFFTIFFPIFCPLRQFLHHSSFSGTRSRFAESSLG